MLYLKSRPPGSLFLAPCFCIPETIPCYEQGHITIHMTGLTSSYPATNPEPFRCGDLEDIEDLRNWDSGTASGHRNTMQLEYNAPTWLPDPC